VLVEKLCKDLGEKSKMCAMVREKTPEFPPDRCQGIMTNYPQVLADLKQREDAEKPLTAEKQKAIASNAVGAFGPEDAKVTIVEFSDFQCPFCSKAADVVKQLKEKYGTKVRFVFRHFPLPFHQDAHLASQAAVAAGEQGKFFEYHDMLFKNQQKLAKASLEEYAKKLGLDLNKFKKALDSKSFAKTVDDDIALGKQVAVQGTPTMFLNGERIANPTDFAGLSKQIDQALN
jgi:protein-disulfide isomerase